jgi:hypothetical protein
LAAGDALMTMMRRQKWILLTGFGLLMAIAYFLFWPSPLHVIVYNNADRLFDGIRVTIGSQFIENAALQPDESISLGFAPVREAVDVNLEVQGDPPLRWTAPYLADPDMAQITLRVDKSNTVTMTAEPTWHRHLQLLLNQLF